MSRLLLAACCLAALPVAARALEPGLDRPYKLDLVVHVARHRLLTDVFKDQFQRELRDSIQAGLGALGDVSVLTDHPRLPVVLEKGLGPALDMPTEVSETKTHFVLVDYANGRYRVQTRQVDGLTGQPSPVVREAQTADRAFVARLAALLVDRDFGLVGTVIERVDEQDLKVAIRGGKLGVPLERWLKKDDVFALSLMQPAGAGLRAIRVPWALVRLQEEPRDGVAVCRLFKRLADPSGDALLQCRCLRLTTVSAPLRLRLVQSTPGGGLSAPPTLELQMRTEGFQTTEKDMLRGVTDADGIYQSERAFPGVVFVNVLRSGTLRARIPIPLVDEQTVRVPINIESESSTPLMIRKNLWVQALYDSHLVQAELFRELNAMIQKSGETNATLERAREGLRHLQRDLASFGNEQRYLATNNQEQPANGKVDLKEGEQRLDELRKTVTKLESFIAGLEETARRENDPKVKELQAKVQQAQLLEDEAEFDKAIKLYEELLAAGLDSDKVRTHLAQLKKSWEIKSGSHQRAREFIYNTWPTSEITKSDEPIIEARRALDACRDAGDKLTPQKLLRVAIAHVAQLKKSLAGLAPDVNEEDNDAAKVIARAADQLNALITETTEYLK